MARRIPNIKRRHSRGRLRETPPRFVLFCEGESTEKKYFEAFRQIFRGAIPKIKFKSAESDPKTIYEKAKFHKAGCRNSFDEKDQIWAVFDHDGRENYEEYSNKCLEDGINVARSNPCFELWLILHIQNCDNPGDSRDMQNLLEGIHPQYDHNRGACPDCKALLKNLEKAEKRAEIQLGKSEKGRDGPYFRRPYTTVFRLTGALRGK